VHFISVIVCSRADPAWTVHERNVAKTAGSAHEYLRIDNRSGRYGICAAYNKGIEQARGDILVFIHEDVFFMETNWTAVLAEKFAGDPALGLVGVAGTQYLFADRMAWTAAGRPWLRGRVVHELDAGNEFAMTAFSLDKSDAEVVAVDGLFFAVRRTLFNRVRFDEATFDHFHFYDLDICMQIRETHRIMVTWDILVKHLSGGKADDSWRDAGKKFLMKYQGRLPASCVATTPDPTKVPEMGINIDLRGKASSRTIC
jgi:glycosyltransferase involved in cell wall biosynthesis